MSERFLEGVRVLDLTRLLPGPFCTLLLADMGADVIKVEDTGGGDYARHYPPLDDDGVGAFFAAINRNKRSIALDLKTPEGVAFFERMVAEADVVIESFRPGVMERLGVGWESLRGVNPGLIYCAVTGFGQTGPMRDAAGHDIGYLGLSGLLSLNGRADGPPVVPGFQLADLGGGALYAALGITSALFRKERTGEGAFLDISMTEGALSFGIPTFATAGAGDVPERGETMLGGGIAAYNIYETSDGRHLAVGALEPKFWMPFVSSLGLDDILADGHDVEPDGGLPAAKVAEVIQKKTFSEWLDFFAGLDVCVEPVLTVEEAMEHELHRARSVFFELNGVQHARTPLTPTSAEHRPAPAHGANTFEIVQEFGGDVDSLTAAGAILSS